MHRSKLAFYCFTGIGITRLPGKEDCLIKNIWSGSLICCPWLVHFQYISLKTNMKQKELKVDILIVGGSLGGCAAAIAATSLGKKVVMTEETDWIGGQLTS